MAFSKGWAVKVLGVILVIVGLYNLPTGVVMLGGAGAMILLLCATPVGRRACKWVERIAHRLAALVVTFMLISASANAQSDPWSTMAQRLETTMAGPVARALTIVGIVVGGLTLIFSEGGGKRMLGGLLFGGAMAIGAATFVTWLFT